MKSLVTTCNYAVKRSPLYCDLQVQASDSLRDPTTELAPPCLEPCQWARGVAFMLRHDDDVAGVADVKDEGLRIETTL